MEGKDDEAEPQKKNNEKLHEARTVQKEAPYTTESEDGKKKPPVKKIPVFFLDEAHKLPALIQTDTAMKSLLDAMLVLTKQDRLIHWYAVSTCSRCTADRRTVCTQRATRSICIGYDR